MRWLQWRLSSLPLAAPAPLSSPCCSPPPPLSSSSSLLSLSLTVFSSCCGMGPALTPPHPTGTYWNDAVAVSKNANDVSRSSNSSDTSSNSCHASRMSAGSDDGMWDRALRLRLDVSVDGVGAEWTGGGEASELDTGALICVCAWRELLERRDGRWSNAHQVGGWDPTKQQWDFDR